MVVSQRVFDVVLGNLFGAVMSIGMSFLMLAMSIGFVDDFLAIWWRSAATGYVISIPIAVLVFPIGGRLLSQLLEVADDE